MKHTAFILSLFWTFLLPPDKPAYVIYNAKGERVDYQTMLDSASLAQVVLFGEMHDNPICHWLQMEFTKDLYEKQGGRVMLGAEMFETDNQLLLNEYVSGQIREKNFEDEVKLWPNYKTDYRPLVRFAKEYNTGFIATNIPRRYASMVFHQGLGALENLSPAAKELLPPLPITVDLELPGYKALLDMADGDPGGETFPQAQAVKDATMGYFIIKGLVDNGTFIHYNGTYHSNNHEGISWYIQHYRPNTQTMTIASVTQEDISTLGEGNMGIADFVICIPETMTRTY